MYTCTKELIPNHQEVYLLLQIKNIYTCSYSEFLTTRHWWECSEFWLLILFSCMFWSPSVLYMWGTDLREWHIRMSWALPVLLYTVDVVISSKRAPSMSVYFHYVFNFHVKVSTHWTNSEINSNQIKVHFVPLTVSVTYCITSTIDGVHMQGATTISRKTAFEGLLNVVDPYRIASLCVFMWGCLSTSMAVGQRWWHCTLTALDPAN